MSEIITKVGRYKVRDGSAPVSADGDTIEMTIAEALAYDRAAAHIVFSDAEEVGSAELKFARKALGLRQTELAEKLGFSEAHLSKLETGHHPIQKQTRLAVLALLKQALEGPAWPPTAWVAMEPQSRPSCLKIPLKRKIG